MNKFLMIKYKGPIIMSYQGFPDTWVGKESARNAGDPGNSLQFLGRKNSLKKGQATHSSILAWRIPDHSPWGHKELDTTEWLSLS